jgi:hypothetical protein
MEQRPARERRKRLSASHLEADRLVCISISIVFPALTCLDRNISKIKIAGFSAYASGLNLGRVKI